MSFFPATSSASSCANQVTSSCCHQGLGSSRGEGDSDAPVQWGHAGTQTVHKFLLPEGSCSQQLFRIHPSTREHRHAKAPPLCLLELIIASMTVEVLPPFSSDFGDLSKQLGLFDNMDPFTEDELALLETGTFDFPGVLTGPAQAVVPDLWALDAAKQQHGASGSPCTLVGASSGTVVPDFVKLEDLHAAQLPAAAGTPSPASSGSHTSYAPSVDDGSR